MSLTLCLLCRDFREEGHLGHSDKWEAEQLQKHSDGELGHLH